MTSIVTISNMALSNLGKKSITNLDEKTTEARACKQWYDHTLRVLLQAYPYRWAEEVRSLAGMALNDDTTHWLYAYSVPVDCLKIRAIGINPGLSAGDPVPYLGAGYDPQRGFPYDRRGQTLYCNINPCFLSFTATQDDPTKFPALFVDALSWHLAARLAMPITRDPKMRGDTLQVANLMQANAQMADANEVRETTDFVSEFDTVRETGVIRG